MSSFYNYDKIFLEIKPYFGKKEYTLILKLNKNDTNKIVETIDIDNKKYSYGIFYENKYVTELCYWHLNKDNFYERLSIDPRGLYNRSCSVILWTADVPGKIQQNTVGKTIHFCNKTHCQFLDVVMKIINLKKY